LRDISGRIVVAAEGKYDNPICLAGPVQVIAHDDGYVSGTGLYVGLSSGDAVITTQGSWRCTVTWTIMKDQIDSGGSCEMVDAAGDKLFGLFSRKGDVQKAEGAFHAVHGTGKFAGITMVRSVPLPAPGQQVANLQPFPRAV